MKNLNLSKYFFCSNINLFNIMTWQLKAELTLCRLFSIIEKISKKIVDFTLLQNLQIIRFQGIRIRFI